MSKFVNFKQRKVTLPPGCKDLIDVLKLQAPAPPVAGLITNPGFSKTKPYSARHESAQGTLSDIEKWVLKVFESDAIACSMDVFPLGKDVFVALQRNGEKGVIATVEVIMGTAEEKAVRAFLAKHGLKPPVESEIPAHFSPYLPIQIACDISPVPTAASEMSSLLIALFREAFSADDNSELQFFGFEMVDSH